MTQRQRNLNMMTKKCQICEKQAEFECSSCNNAFYCSEQHQKKHWKTHKPSCFKQPKVDRRQQQQLILTNRREFRKNYYENFILGKWQDCLTVAEQLEQIQQKNLLVTYNYFDQFEHGAAVCLLIRTLIILSERMTAKLKLQAYLKSNRVLEDTRNLPKGKNADPKSYEFFVKKLSLISTLANLQYQITSQCIKLYILYTENVEIVFGSDSPELSNCYFLIGCYYAEKQQFIKAIACFKRAAQIRGQQSGDCYFNMGILYKWLLKNNKAIEMFEKALAKRRELYGQFTLQVAQTLEHMGIIFIQQMDFKAAISKLESAYMIRNTDPLHPDFKRLSDLIVHIYQKLDSYVNNQEVTLQKQEVFKHLRQDIQQMQMTPQIRKKIADTKNNKIEKPNVVEDFIDTTKKKDINRFKGTSQGLKQLDKEIKESKLQQEAEEEKAEDIIEQEQYFRLRLSPQFVSKLTSFETYHLSQLQLQLQDCKTQYRAVMIANNSKFVKSLDKNRLKILKQSNRHIFGQYHIANAKIQKKTINAPKLISQNN